MSKAGHERPAGVDQRAGLQTHRGWSSGTAIGASAVALAVMSSSRSLTLCWAAMSTVRAIAEQGS